MSEEVKEDSGIGEIPGRPGRKPTKEQPIRDKLKEYAHWVALIGGLIPAVTASVISVMTAYRGEPEANRAYDLLAPQVNAHKTSLQIILSRLAKIEGHYEGMEMGKLSARIETLLQENSELKKKLEQPPTAVKSNEPTSQAVPPPGCKEGFVQGDDKRCHRVQPTVAKKFQKTLAKKKEYEEWLRREKEKRQLLEQKVRMLKQHRPPAPAPPPSLKTVPDSLEAAKKAD
jgi:hypothetical protein